MPDTLDLFEQTASSIDEVCSTFDDPDWELPTDLPGWTVKDNLSHLVHYEATAIGSPTPDDVDISAYDHVKDEFQAANERGVEFRRARSGREVLAEFQRAVPEHIAMMRAFSDEDWGTKTLLLPPGEGIYAQFLPIRVSDFFFHEQDMRRATGRPGHLNGAVARFIFDRFANAMGYVLVKGAKAPDGTRARFEIGEPGETFDVEVTDGRGAKASPDGEPTATFRGDLESFLCLVGGRWSPEAAQADGRWSTSGDADLIAAVHATMAVIP